MTTNFQNRLFDYISNYLNEKGDSPKYAEMWNAMNIRPTSKSLITRSIRALEKAGKIILNKKGRRLLISIPNKNRW